jgi:hypothetical protein
MVMNRVIASCFLASTLLVLAACGGGGDSSAPTGTTQPGAPASLSIVTGDGQSAALRAVLPVRLSVLVKDAAGRAVPNVAVQFSVDSGGGSLSSTSATSGADGVALGGDWTLGSSVGAQVVTARVGALTPLKFRAQALGPTTQTLFAQTPVGPGGSTLVYRKAGDKLDGLTIGVPAGAFPVSTQWTVIADSTAPVTLPADFTQVGPTLVIGNGQGYADSVMTLTLPLPSSLNVTDADGVAPFYYDDASATFEGIPLVERTATSVTLATRHFSRDAMALPGNSSEAAAMRRAGVVAFGAVKIVWVKTPKTKLIGTFNSGFRVGVDNWEFENQGEYVDPNGSCEGMSVTAMYYFYFMKGKGAPALYHHYDLTLENVLDNVQGIRFTGSVQGDYIARYEQGFVQEKALADAALAKGAKLEDLTSIWILLTLKLTKNPVLLGIHGPPGGHAVVAYSASSTGAHTDVAFADPNFPKIGRTMAFESGQMTPVSLQLKVGGPGGNFNKVYALAVSSEIPLAQIDARYAEFKRGKAGADRYPSDYKVEFYNNLSEAWEPLTSTLNTTDAELNLRFICKGCPTPTVGGAPNQHPIEIWDGAGAASLAPSGFLLNTLGTTKYYAKLDAFTVSVPSKSGFMDAVPFTVVYRPFTISPPANIPKLHQSGTYTANAGELATTGATYTWQVDDGTAAVVTSTPSFTHTYDRPGLNIITVTLKDASGKAIAKANWGSVIAVAVSLSPVPISATLNSPVTISAVVAGGLPVEVNGKVTYTWTIEGQGVDVDFTTTVPTLTYAFPKLGTYSVSVVLSMPGVAGGADLDIGNVFDVVATVRDVFPVWKFTSFVLDVDQSGANPFTGNPLIGSTNHLTYELGVFTGIRDALKQGGLLYVARDTTFLERPNGLTSLKKRGLYVVDGALLTNPLLSTVLAMPAENGTFTQLSDPTAIRGSWIVSPPASAARVADTPLLNEGYTETGSITNGNITGTYWRFQTSTFTQANGFIWFPFETRQANVNFSGSTATGTITIVGRDYDHTNGNNLPKPETKRWTVKVTFTAVRIP